jgi:hypothetical protein
MSGRASHWLVVSAGSASQLYAVSAGSRSQSVDPSAASACLGGWARRRRFRLTHWVVMAARQASRAANAASRAGLEKPCAVPAASSAWLPDRPPALVPVLAFVAVAVGVVPGRAECSRLPWCRVLECAWAASCAVCCCGDDVGDDPCPPAGWLGAGDEDAFVLREGLGFGVDFFVGLGDGFGLELLLGDGDGFGVFEGEGDGVGVPDGDGDGDGLAAGDVADDDGEGLGLGDVAASAGAAPDPTTAVVATINPTAIK